MWYIVERSFPTCGLQRHIGASSPLRLSREKGQAIAARHLRGPGNAQVGWASDHLVGDEWHPSEQGGHTAEARGVGCIQPLARWPDQGFKHSWVTGEALSTSPAMGCLRNRTAQDMQARSSLYWVSLYHLENAKMKKNEGKYSTRKRKKRGSLDTPVPSTLAPRSTPARKRGQRLDGSGSILCTSPWSDPRRSCPLVRSHGPCCRPRLRAVPLSCKQRLRCSCHGPVLIGSAAG